MCKRLFILAAPIILLTATGIDGLRTERQAGRARARRCRRRRCSHGLTVGVAVGYEFTRRTDQTYRLLVGFSACPAWAIGDF